MFIMPIRSFDFTGVPSNIAWGFGFYLIGKGIDHLLKQHPIQLNRKTIWKNYQWSKVVSCGLAFLGVAYVGEFCEKIHFKKGKKICDSRMMNCITTGIATFCKLEPELTYQIFKKLEEFVIQTKINKITGLNVYRF